MNFVAFDRVFASPFETYFPRPLNSNAPWAVLSSDSVMPTGVEIHHAPDYENGPILSVQQHGTRYFVSYRELRAEIGPTPEIKLDVPAPMSTATLTQILERVVLPIAMLRWTDSIAVHGSGVEIDTKSFLFLGDSHSGKSTLALELLRRGAKLLSDDLSLIEDRDTVSSAAPTIRTWHSVEHTGLVASAPVAPETKKLWHLFEPQCAATGRNKIAAIIHVRLGDAYSFQALSGAEKLTRLLDQTFSFTNATSAFDEHRFQTAAEIARLLPTFVCVIPYCEPASRAQYYDQVWNSLIA